MKYYVIGTFGTRIFEDVESFREFYKANRDNILFFSIELEINLI